LKTVRQFSWSGADWRPCFKNWTAFSKLSAW